jgi:primosomal protein N'
MKKVMMYVVDPKALTDEAKTKLRPGQQVLVQFKNGRYTVGDVCQYYTSSGPGNVILAYKMGRASQIVMLRNKV